MVLSALVLRNGGDGGVGLYVFGALAGGAMAMAFGPLLTRVLSEVPTALAADASGVVQTVVQLGLVVGIATYGALFLNLAGKLPSRRSAAFALSSAHAYFDTSFPAIQVFHS
jgi:hypothetical protein